MLFLPGRIENNRSFYGSFSLGPFEAGQSITIANALRRTLLSELKGLAITSAEIEGAFHEYSTLPGVRDSILDILLNLKDIVLKRSVHYGNKKRGASDSATFKTEQIGYLKTIGPGVVTASELKLPPGIQCVDPDQYIATLSEEGILNIKFYINEGKNYVIQSAENCLINKAKSYYTPCLASFFSSAAPPLQNKLPTEVEQALFNSAPSSTKKMEGEGQARRSFFLRGIVQPLKLRYPPKAFLRGSFLSPTGRKTAATPPPYNKGNKGGVVEAEGGAFFPFPYWKEELDAFISSYAATDLKQLWLKKIKGIQSRLNWQTKYKGSSFFDPSAPFLPNTTKHLKASKSFYSSPNQVLTLLEEVSKEKNPFLLSSVAAFGRSKIFFLTFISGELRTPFSKKTQKNPYYAYKQLRCLKKPLLKVQKKSFYTQLAFLKKKCNTPYQKIDFSMQLKNRLAKLYKLQKFLKKKSLRHKKASSPFYTLDTSSKSVNTWLGVRSSLRPGAQATSFFFNQKGLLIEGFYKDEVAGRRYKSLAFSSYKKLLQKPTFYKQLKISDFYTSRQNFLDFNNKIIAPPYGGGGTWLSNPLAIDAVFMPVNKVNYIIEINEQSVISKDDSVIKNKNTTRELQNVPRASHAEGTASGTYKKKKRRSRFIFFVSKSTFLNSLVPFFIPSSKSVNTWASLKLKSYQKKTSYPSSCFARLAEGNSKHVQRSLSPTLLLYHATTSFGRHNRFLKAAPPLCPSATSPPGRKWPKGTFISGYFFPYIFSGRQSRDFGCLRTAAYKGFFIKRPPFLKKNFKRGVASRPKEEVACAEGRRLRDFVRRKGALYTSSKSSPFLWKNKNKKEAAWLGEQKNSLLGQQEGDNSFFPIIHPYTSRGLIIDSFGQLRGSVPYWKEEVAAYKSSLKLLKAEPLEAFRSCLISSYLENEIKNMRLNSTKTSLKNNIILEIWTNGSIHPRAALYEACKNLYSLFSKLEKTKFIPSACFALPYLKEKAPGAFSTPCVISAKPSLACLSSWPFYTKKRKGNLLFYAAKNLSSFKKKTFFFKAACPLKNGRGGRRRRRRRRRFLYKLLLRRPGAQATSNSKLLREGFYKASYKNQTLSKKLCFLGQQQFFYTKEAALDTPTIPLKNQNGRGQRLKAPTVLRGYRNLDSLDTSSKSSKAAWLGKLRSISVAYTMLFKKKTFGQAQPMLSSHDFLLCLCHFFLRLRSKAKKDCFASRVAQARRRQGA
uniref:Plastid-encoded RNA polymerase subunit alpha n=1 Tax=Chloromonas radiata TaxID=47907 RepID=A0A0S2ICI6_9CHLO|nr:alpha subunit of RNA polymerase [Chloromonas radiata]